MSSSSSPEWFAEWFASPYYKHLYTHRSDAEADAFIRRLVAHLRPPQQARYLDLACGTGRHSATLSSLGIETVGVDLSEPFIQEATARQLPHASFQEMDMRQLAFDAAFDAVLNLFTSLGYFTDTTDNLDVLLGANRALKPGGKLVIDFLNALHVETHLVPHEELTRNHLHFVIDRRIEDGFVVKTIQVQDGNDTPTYQERVRLYTPTELEQLLSEAGFIPSERWGDYAGTPFDVGSSKRLVIFAHKATDAAE